MSVLLNGIGVSKGIAIGQAYVLYREQPEIREYNIPEENIKDEIKRFHTARKKAHQQLHEIKQKISADVPQDISQFIETSLLMLDDPVFCNDTVKQIEQRICNAEWALQAQCNRLVKVFDEMDDPYLKTRKDDVIHVVQRIQRCLIDDEQATQADDETDHLKGRIIIADDLTPADTILMQHQKIAGFITEYGGPLSHTAILASNLGIPAVVGIHNAKQLILAGEWLIIDGNEGMIVVDPDKKTLKHFKSLQKDEKQRKRNLFELKNKPAKTLDGHQIILNGNIDRPEDIKTLRQFDHTGVGLYRTEMLFLERNENPSEEEQFETYRRALRALKGKPLTIRTVDLGADKELDSTLQHGPLAHNPAMGLRAIRRCLKEPDQFLKQLRAILRVASYGPIKMMIPMMTCISELDQTLELIEQAKEELKTNKQRFNPQPLIGAMIEVPAAALSAHSFAEKLDFLSIGTNDLIQYTLALDRIDDEVSHLYKPLNPSVLKLIDITIQAGINKGISVSLCGEMASEPLYTRLLLGMGLKDFSVQANSLLEIKHIINNSRIDKLAPEVRKLLTLSYPDEIEHEVFELNKKFS
ncbi:MAG: phosphoenolpyruvate--protein phosphotransferase [Gammaproteobacteria bacterium]|nr:phosphoenolpyruvate--protein phosphotransferase [Gammaproteobacteria bacterium]MCW8909502.1 phosphoenolpyruvate--protein phosphotransferase [Gammaproteobacteria bacterium]MCW9004415.1 phosphoenolpyruvate--protein phosphotransferase [Gammaproteobacteria bacterium]MCW9055796.1 phosphoenolpyruvate--protein phosphotransferase [Gammaproteobacteria bacterium]